MKINSQFEIEEQPLTPRLNILFDLWIQDDFNYSYGDLDPQNPDDARILSQLRLYEMEELFQPVYIENLIIDVAYTPNIEQFSSDFFEILKSAIISAQQVKRAHIIYVTPEWKYWLFKSGFVKMIRKCKSLGQMLLLLSGDVELNPGPVYIRDLKRSIHEFGATYQNKRLFRQAWNKFYNDGTVDQMNDYYQQRQVIRAQIGIEVNHHIPVIEEFMKSKAINEIIEGTALVNDMISGDMLERIKVRCVSLCTVIYNLCRWSQGMMQTTDLIVNLTSALINSVSLTMMQDVFKRIFATVAQDSTGTLRTLLKAILVCVFLLTAGTLPGRHTVDEFINRIHSIPRAMTGLDQFWSKIDPIVNTATDFVDEHLYGADVSASHQEYVANVQEWADKVSEYSSLFRRRQINKDAITLETAGKLHVEGIRLMAKCQRLGYDRKNADLIRSLLATTYKISEAALKSGADKCKVRREPTMVWFCGGSGVGKSTVTYPFLLDMMKYENEDMTNWQQKVYARAPETEYWDGYTDQEYIVYDDAFQLKDSIANPSPELFELIRLGNMFPYMLHMASLEEKSNSFACPKLVFLSSNLERIIAESIHCKEAVARRIEFAFKTELKPEYRQYYTLNNQQVYKLDRSKVNKAKAIDLDTYQFIRFDPHTGSKISQPMSYHDVVTLVGNYMKQSKDNFSSYDDFLEQYAKQPVDLLDWDNNADDTIHAQIGLDEADNPWAFDRHGCVNTPQGTYVAPGYKLADGFRDGWYIKFRNLLWDIPMDLTAQAACWWEGKGYYVPFSNYFHHRRASMVNVMPGCLYYQNQDYYFHEDNLPREGLIISQVDLDYVESAKKRWRSWVQGVFKPMYYKARFNIPGICVRIIGLLAAAFTFRRLYQKYFPKKKTLTELIDEVRSELDKAEVCAKNGCQNCRKCRNATESYINDYYYWGVPCACYVDVCRRQNEKNKRIFMAYLNTKRVDKVTQNPVAQSKMFDFAASCECDHCPLCSEDKCVCRVIARERGCDIGDEDLIDRVGIYAAMPKIEEVIAQNNDHLGKVQGRRQQIKVQNNDHLGKVQTRRQNIRVQNNDHLGKVRQQKAKIHVQDNEGSLRPDWQMGAVFQANSAAMYDKAAMDVMDNRIWPQLMRIYVTKPGDEAVVRHFGHITFIKGSVFLMNWHFKLALEDYSKYDIVIRAMQSTVYKRLSVPEFLKRVVKIENKDACLIALDDKGVSFSDIVKHFQSKSVAYSHDIQALTIARYAVHSREMMPYPIFLNNARLSSEPISIEMTAGGETVYFINPISWEYTAATKDGDCGAPLILYNSRIPTKIVGIHNAAHIANGQAFGVPLYREEIEKALSEFSIEFQFGWAEPQVFETTEALKFNDGDNFVVVRVEKGALPSSGKSSVIRSPLYEKISPTLTKPGFLRPFKNAEGIIVDPAVKQRSKWGFDQPKVDKNLAERCTQAVIQLNCRKIAPDCDYYHYPLTTEQAIKGIDGVEGINSINKTSSPGYPYVLDKRAGRGKTGYFGSFEFDLTTAGARQVINDINTLERQYLDNERPFIAWIDTLKDARIPIEKADAGKTRIFSAGPMHYCIVYRKYFLPFFAHIMQNRVDNWMAPGINPVSPEWHKLALRLRSKGKHVIAGDYSNYDGKACTEGYKACYKAAVHWYINLHWEEVVAEGRNIVQGVFLNKKRFEQFLLNIAFDCTTHVHVCEKEYDNEKYRIFYQVMNGMPSGNPGTAITNSECGIWMLLYCWMEIFEGTMFGTPEAFFEHVYACTYGDDVVINISDIVIEHYNQTVLTEAMKRNFDIDFTDEAKTGNETPKSRTLDQISFLKRRFVFNDYLQLYVAPMPEDVLLDILNWCKDGAEDVRVITVNNLNAVLGELSFISKSTYDKYYPIFNKHLNTLTKCTNLFVVLDTYTGYLEKYRNNKLVPIE